MDPWDPSYDGTRFISTAKAWDNLRASNPIDGGGGGGEALEWPQATNPLQWEANVSLAQSGKSSIILGREGDI